MIKKISKITRTHQYDKLCIHSGISYIYIDKQKTFTIVPIATFTFHEKNSRKHLDIPVNNKYKYNLNFNKAFSLGLYFHNIFRSRDI